MNESGLSINMMKKTIERVSKDTKIILENGGMIEIVEAQDAIRGKGTGFWWLNEEEEVDDVPKMKGEQIADLIMEWASEQNLHPDDFSVLFVEELIELLDRDGKEGA